VELRNTIVQQYGIDVPATFIYDYPTLGAMANYLSDHRPAGSASMDSVCSGPLEHQGSLSMSSGTSRATYTEIVALSSRHPGAALGADAFLSNIATAADLQSTVPLSRWDIDSVFTPELDNSPVPVTTRFASFCEDIDLFDSAAFKLSSAEAVGIDPQTR
jgi:hypothetical protein